MEDSFSHGIHKKVIASFPSYNSENYILWYKLTISRQKSELWDKKLYLYIFVLFLGRNNTEQNRIARSKQRIIIVFNFFLFYFLVSVYSTIFLSQILLIAIQIETLGLIAYNCGFPEANIQLCPLLIIRALMHSCWQMIHNLGIFSAKRSRIETKNAFYFI